MVTFTDFDLQHKQKFLSFFHSKFISCSLVFFSSVCYIIVRQNIFFQILTERAVIEKPQGKSLFCIIPEICQLILSLR